MNVLLWVISRMALQIYVVLCWQLLKEIYLERCNHRLREAIISIYSCWHLNITAFKSLKSNSMWFILCLSFLFFFWKAIKILKRLIFASPATPHCNIHLTYTNKCANTHTHTHSPSWDLTLNVWSCRDCQDAFLPESPWASFSCLRIRRCFHMFHAA